MEEIGYAIDFKEIKRVFCQWIDDILDHGMLLNPHDTKLIETTKDYGTKLWLMSLNGEGEYCNPSVENIAREVFLAMDIMTSILYGGKPTGLKIHRVTIYETPNCWTEVKAASITDAERNNFIKARWNEISEYAKAKGVLEYDDRRINLEGNPKGNITVDLLSKKYSSKRDDVGAEDWANYLKK
jgi:6-pyruvoyltetrahydropterin/6-carboxytetrahydropterin synthase